MDECAKIKGINDPYYFSGLVRISKASCIRLRGEFRDAEYDWRTLKSYQLLPEYFLYPAYIRSIDQIF